MRILFNMQGEILSVEATCVRTCHDDNVNGIAFKAPNTIIGEIDNKEWYFVELEDYVAEEMIISSFSSGLLDLRNYPVEQRILSKPKQHIDKKLRKYYTKHVRKIL